MIGINPAVKDRGKEDVLNPIVLKQRLGIGKERIGLFIFFNLHISKFS